MDSLSAYLRAVFFIFRDGTGQIGDEQGIRVPRTVGYTDLASGIFP